MNDRLRPLWDFDDLETTEKRLREQLDAETTDAAGLTPEREAELIEAWHGHR